MEAVKFKYFLIQRQCNHMLASFFLLPVAKRIFGLHFKKRNARLMYSNLGYILSMLASKCLNLLVASKQDFKGKATKFNIFNAHF